MGWNPNENRSTLIRPELSFVYMIANINKAAYPWRLPLLHILPVDTTLPRY